VTVPAVWTDHPPLVGRQRELRALSDLVDALRDGRGGVALISGEPGIGKTRLLLEVGRYAQAAACQVLVGRAYASDGMPPYLPLVEALRDHLRACRPEQALAYLHACSELASLLPEWSDALPADSPSLARRGHDPEVDRYQLFESFTRVLVAIAEPGRGLLLCLDDLHWADPPTLQALLHLARRLDAAPILVLATHRSTASELGQPLLDALAELSRERLRLRIALGALSHTESDEFVAMLAGDVSTAEDNLAAIHARTGGNPFFTRELVRHLRDQGVDLAQGAALGSDWGVPESVHQVIGRRLARLGATANALLQAGAVFGDPLSLPVLSAMLPLPTTVVLDAVDDATRAGLLREERDQYVFSHALVRETLYRGLSLARRQQLHLKAASALERVHGRARAGLELHLGELARHLSAAGDLADSQQLMDYVERAGDAALRLLAFEEAAAHWQQALQLMRTRGVDPARQARVLERLGELSHLAGIDYTTGITCLEQALELYAWLGQLDAAARVHARLGSALSTLPETWDLPRAVEHYQHAEAILRSTEVEDVRLGWVYVGLAQVAVWNVRVPEGLAASGRALEIAEHVHDDALWAQAATARGGHLVSDGRISEGLQLMHRGWRAADRLNDPGAFFAAFLGSAFAHWLVDPRELGVWCDRELARPRIAQAPGPHRRLQGRLAAARALAGDMPAAGALASEAGASYDTWEVLFWQGDWDACGALASQRISASRRSGERAFAFEATFDLARVRAAQGQLQVAKALLEEALAVAVDGGEQTYAVAVRALLARVCAESGCQSEARRHVDDARRSVSNGDDWRGLAGQLDLAEAMVVLADGARDAAAAEDLLLHAIETFRRQTFPWGEAEGLLVWGCALSAAGHAAQAERKWRDAETLYRRHEAGAAWAARVERYRVALASTAGGLSQRELEVLRLVAAGRTNRQIADELVISLHTVVRHVSNIFDKTGVSNRAEAAAYAHHQGVVAGE
jgi:DNA-binding CsgD family transcriptional regulator